MSSIAAALKAGAARLATAGIADPMRDARLLMAHALEVEAGRLTPMLPDPLPPGAAVRFEAALAARASRKPVSQITGRRLFWGRVFHVTPDVLDPRPETETLIAAALEASFARVLDLGTGSGCILLSLLAARPGARGVGTDISAAALAVAEENARSLGVAERCRFQRADWFGGLEGRFDLIVSNPPYIAESEMAGLAPELAHEPRAALTDGGDGLSAYRAIAAGAGRHLTGQGRLLLEIGWRQGPDVLAILRAAGFEGLQILPDLDGRDRVVAAVRGTAQG